MMFSKVRLIFLVAVVVGIVCSVQFPARTAAQSPDATATAVPAATVVPTAAAATTSSGATGKLDMDKLIPHAQGQEAGRDLVLQYCFTCHNIAPLVLANKTPDEWNYLLYNDHAGRISLQKPDWDTMYAYLVAGFPPDRQVPDLPPELLKDWTQY
jgi:hypothetical protein